jgi:TonB family protein
MITSHSFKIVIITLIGALAGFSSAQGQAGSAPALSSGSRHGAEPIVTTGSAPGLIKKIEPEYPIGFVIHGAKGRGKFRLTINPRSGLVDEVKIIQSTGYQDLNKLAVKALLQWQFKPGSASPVVVPVEFDIQGGNRILH